MQKLSVWMSVLLLVAALGGATLAQDAVVSPALDTQLQGIERYVSEYRGLELNAPLNRVFPSREVVSAYLIETIEEQLTPQALREYMGFYVAFDLLPADTDLIGVYLALLEQQVGGYYDPEAKTMNTILLSGGELGDSLPVLEQIIYAHEFVHTLQDQNFGLADIGFSADTRDSYDTDQLLAISALVEGDATAVMNAYTIELQNRNPLAAFQLLTATFASGAMSIPEGTPEILFRELTFPYNQGAVFVGALLAEGGWARVDAAFSDLPRSTEQILHPEKYLAGEQPIPVTLSATDGVLGADWSLVTEDTLGQYYLREYLRTQLSSEVYAGAAQGWGGDRYRVYTHDTDGTLALLLRIMWDTPADADEFVSAYSTFAAQRNATDGDGTCWIGTEDTLCMRTLGADDVLISRAPTQAQALALLESQN